MLKEMFLLLDLIIERYWLINTSKLFLFFFFLVQPNICLSSWRIRVLPGNTEICVEGKRK